LEENENHVEDDDIILSQIRCPQCMICEICTRDKDSDNLLACDVCHRVVHYSCVDPSIDSIPPHVRNFPTQIERNEKQKKNR